MTLKKLLLLLTFAGLTLATSGYAEPDFTPLVGKSLEFAIQEFGDAHYQKTINYILHGQNCGLVDIYLFNIGYGFLEVWVNKHDMGKMPAEHVVLVKSYLRNTGNRWRDAMEGL
jgi:hypothetical protein